jgi:hypothetical protein
MTSAALTGLAIYCAGYLAAAFLPCDLGCRPQEPSLSQVLHNALGLVGYLIAPWCLFVLARQARHWPGARALAIWGAIAGAITLVGVVTLAPESPLAGLSQRAIEATVLSWIVLSAVYLRSRA